MSRDITRPVHAQGSETGRRDLRLSPSRRQTASGFPGRPGLAVPRLSVHRITYRDVQPACRDFSQTVRLRFMTKLRLAGSGRARGEEGGGSG